MGKHLLFKPSYILLLYSSAWILLLVFHTSGFVFCQVLMFLKKENLSVLYMFSLMYINRFSCCFVLFHSAESGRQDLSYDYMKSLLLMWVLRPRIFLFNWLSFHIYLPEFSSDLLVRNCQSQNLPYHLVLFATALFCFLCLS